MESFADAVVYDDDDAVTLSDTDQSLFDNVRAFYRNQCEEDMVKIGREASPRFASPRFTDTPPTLPSAFAMNKVCASPAFRRGGSSANVAVEEIGGDDSSEQDDFITILTYSRSPSEDFRRSMQEMVEARVKRKEVVDREFMEELLFRYLDLNNEKFYGCIVRAFLDLIAFSGEDPVRIRPHRRSYSWMRRGRKRLKLEIKRMRKFWHKSNF